MAVGSDGTEWNEEGPGGQPQLGLHGQRARTRRALQVVVGLVPVQIWEGASPVPVQMWDGAGPVPEQMWEGIDWPGTPHFGALPLRHQSALCCAASGMGR